MKIKKITLSLLILFLAWVMISLAVYLSTSVKLDDYKIVYSASDSETVVDAVFELSELIGVECVTDLSSEADKHEIIIGNTNRPESMAGSADLLFLDYSVKYDNKRIVICGGSDQAISSGVKWFYENCVSDGKAKKKSFVYRHEYRVKSLTVSGKSIKSFNIISTSTDGAFESFEKALEQELTDATGFLNKLSADSLNIMIKLDGSLDSNSFSIKVETGDITISAVNSYGLEAAFDYFLKNILKEKTVLNDGDQFMDTIYDNEQVYADFINIRSPLTNTHEKLTKNKELNIVYFGGSVTAGHGASSSATTSWRALCSRWFDSTYPDAKINHYNSSIGGSGSMLGAFRCAHDILSLKPDLVFIELAVNDVYCGTSDSDIKLYYESIIRQIKQDSPDCDIVALYVTDQRRARSNNNGYYTQALAQELVAKHYSVPSVYLGGALCSTFDYTNDEKWAEHFIDIVHPNDSGYSLYFDALREYLEGALIYHGKFDSPTDYVMPEKLSDTEFAPQFILANEIEIIESTNWEISNASYWNTANPYEGYLYPTAADNKLTVSFKGNNAALFAQYGKENRLVYSFDNGNERIQNQSGNHPLLLPCSIDRDTDEHTLNLSVNIKNADSPYIISAMLVW